MIATPQFGMSFTNRNKSCRSSQMMGLRIPGLSMASSTLRSRMPNAFSSALS